MMLRARNSTSAFCEPCRASGRTLSFSATKATRVMNPHACSKFANFKSRCRRCSIALLSTFGAVEEGRGVVLTVQPDLTIRAISFSVASAFRVALFEAMNRESRASPPSEAAPNFIRYELRILANLLKIPFSLVCRWNLASTHAVDALGDAVGRRVLSTLRPERAGSWLFKVMGAVEL